MHSIQSITTIITIVPMPVFVCPSKRWGSTEHIRGCFQYIDTSTYFGCVRREEGRQRGMRATNKKPPRTTTKTKRNEPMPRHDVLLGSFLSLSAVLLLGLSSKRKKIGTWIGRRRPIRLDCECLVIRSGASASAFSLSLCTCVASVSGRTKGLPDAVTPPVPPRPRV